MKANVFRGKDQFGIEEVERPRAPAGLTAFGLRLDSARAWALNQRQSSGWPHRRTPPK